MDLFDLTNKVAVVTGGNGGLGLGIAEGLVAAGAHLVIAARNATKTAEAAASLRERFNVNVLEVQADVCEESDIQRMVAETMTAFGRLDILVNNAGTNIRKLPDALTATEWQTVIDTNLSSTFLCSQAAYEPMVQGGGGKIINNGSMYSIFGGSHVLAYAASKGGVVQLTKSLAVAWAKDNIQVNVILPGWCMTDCTRPRANSLISSRISSGDPRPTPKMLSARVNTNPRCKSTRCPAVTPQVTNRPPTFILRVRTTMEVRSPRPVSPPIKWWSTAPVSVPATRC